jgi:hypothetical protein
MELSVRRAIRASAAQSIVAVDTNRTSNLLDVNERSFGFMGKAKSDEIVASGF